MVSSADAGGNWALELPAGGGGPVRGAAAAGPAAMGSAQRKLHCKGGGDREAQKGPTESRAKKGTAENKQQKPLSDREANGYLHGGGKSESPEAEQSCGARGAGSRSAGGDGAASLPPAAASLKNEGNELFKSGQFGEAVLRYSEAIECVTGLGECSSVCLNLGLMFRLCKGTTDDLT